MAIDVNLINISSGLLTASALNENNNTITLAFADALSRKPGSTDNAMEAPLDMGGYPINNIAYDENDETSAVTKAVFDTLIADAISTVESYNTDAEASATAADASATAASTAETNAQYWATQSQGAYDDARAAADNAEDLVEVFITNYYGGAATDPTQDAEGNPPIAGALYFNTTNDVMRVYNGAAWQDVV